MHRFHNGNDTDFGLANSVALSSIALNTGFKSRQRRTDHLQHLRSRGLLLKRF